MTHSNRRAPQETGEFLGAPQVPQLGKFEQRWVNCDRGAGAYRDALNADWFKAFRFVLATTSKLEQGWVNRNRDAEAYPDALSGDVSSACAENTGLKFGSSGRTRTYNPSVNSRGNRRTVALQTQGLPARNRIFAGIWGRFGGTPVFELPTPCAQVGFRPSLETVHFQYFLFQ